MPNPDRNPIKQVSLDLLSIMGNPSILDVTKIAGSLEFEYETKTLIMTDQLNKIRESAMFVYNRSAEILSNFAKSK